MSRADCPLLHNMSAPPQSPVQAKNVVVERSLVLFSTVHAWGRLLHMHTEPDIVTWRNLQDNCFGKWRIPKGDIDAFLDALQRLGIPRSSIEARAAGITGSVIGWKGFDTATSRRLPAHEHARFHHDLELTLAILSHTVADLFLPRRAPDYSYRALFQTTLCVSDRRFVLGTEEVYPDPPSSRGYIS